MVFFNRLYDCFKSKSDLAPALSPLEIIIQQSLERNLMLLSGEETPIAVESLPFDTFQKRAKSFTSITSIEYFNKDYTLQGYLLLPAATKDHMFSSFDEFHTEPFEHNEEKSLQMLRTLSGNLYQLFSLDMRVPPADNAWSNGSWLIKEYNSKDEADSLLWKLADYDVLELKTEYSFYFLIETDFHKEIIHYLKDSEACGICESKVMERYDPDHVSMDTEEALEVQIKDKKEFILSSLLMPQGSYEFNSQIDKIAIPNDLQAHFNRICYPVQISLKLDNQPFDIFLVLDGIGLSELKAAFPKGLNSIYKAVLEHIIRNCKEHLGLSVQIANIKGGIIPCLPEGTVPVVLTYDIMLAGKAYKMAMVLPHTMLNVVNAKILEPWELSLFVGNKNNVLLSLLSLNTSLFKKNFSRYVQIINRPASIFDNEDKIENYICFGEFCGDMRLRYMLSDDFQYLIFYQFLNLIPPADMARVIHAYVAAGYPLNSITSCFHIMIPARQKGEGEMRHIVPVSDFNKEAFLLAVPAKYRKEVEESIGEYSPAHIDEFMTANLDIMLKVYEAYCNDRLLLSPKAQTLMEISFYMPFQETYKKECERLIKSLDAKYSSLASEPHDFLRKQVFPKHGYQRFAEAVFGNTKLIADITDVLPKQASENFRFEMEHTKDKIDNDKLLWFDVCKAKSAFINALENLPLPIEQDNEPAHE